MVLAVDALSTPLKCSPFLPSKPGGRPYVCLFDIELHASEYFELTGSLNAVFYGQHGPTQYMHVVGEAACPRLVLDPVPPRRLWPVGIRRGLFPPKPSAPGRECGLFSGSSCNPGPP